MPSVRCLSVLSVCLLRWCIHFWPNGWTVQDETWHAGRPRPWPHCVRWGPTSPSPKGAQPSIFGPCLLRPNGCMDQDATQHGARPRPRRHCVRWGSSSSGKGHSTPPPLFGPVYCGQTVADLSYCWAVVNTLVRNVMYFSALTNTSYHITYSRKLIFI